MSSLEIQYSCIPCVHIIIRPIKLQRRRIKEASCMRGIRFPRFHGLCRCKSIQRPMVPIPRAILRNRTPRPIIQLPIPQEPVINRHILECHCSRKRFLSTRRCKESPRRRCESCSSNQRSRNREPIRSHCHGAAHINIVPPYSPPWRKARSVPHEEFLIWGNPKLPCACHSVDRCNIAIPTIICNREFGIRQCRRIPGRQRSCITPENETILIQMHPRHCIAAPKGNRHCIRRTSINVERDECAPRECKPCDCVLSSCIHQIRPRSSCSVQTCCHCYPSKRSGSLITVERSCNRETKVPVRIVPAICTALKIGRAHV